jgi:hypothetical protein
MTVRDWVHRQLRFLRVFGLVTVILLFGWVAAAWAETCTFFNTVARVCIFDPAGGEDCTETWYTDLVCYGGTIGGPGFLPYFPAGGGGGGGGPIGYPQADGAPTPSQAFKLNQGKVKALEELDTNPTCASLPQTLGMGSWVNLQDTINQTTYRNWDSHARCNGTAGAFTNPNWKYVYLCAKFGDVTAKRAAELVIHEALHSAGLLESPPYDGALTSSQIDAQVRENCPGL